MSDRDTQSYIIQLNYAKSLCRPAVFATLAGVVGHFYAEYYHAGDGGDEVCDNQRPVVYEEALDHKEDAAESEQQESGKSYAVRVTGAYGVDGLRQVTADHADSGNVADYVYKQCVCHRI